MGVAVNIASFCFLFCFLPVPHVDGSWWYLGISGSSLPTDAELEYSPSPVGAADGDWTRTLHRCDELGFLSDQQRRMCLKYGLRMIDAVSRGAAWGIGECQHQFTNRRWNCSIFNTTDVFGKVLDIDSREKGFVYAISSAGVMYAVTEFCARGFSTECGCDTRVFDRPSRGFEWGGCSHDVAFGRRFSQQFVDSVEDRTTGVGLMNLWNNEAGRRTIRAGVNMQCKCHGVSGSCTVKICWRVMPAFRWVGNQLRDRFDWATHVEMHPNRRKLRPKDNRQKKPTKRELVYLTSSPNYCQYDPENGILGTQGRECVKTSPGLDGCRLMCCGRGYSAQETVTVTDCQCKFHWCCRVECKKCRKKEIKYFCK